MPDNVEVRIVGDATGVQPAVDQASTSVGGLTGIIADVNAFLDSCRAKFMQLGSAGVDAGGAIAKGMAGAVAATEAEGNAITAMIMKVHEGAESVRTFQMRAKEFAEVYVAIFAVEAVAHWVEALAGAAEQTAKLSATLGMTVGQVQGLSGAATMSGTSMDALTRALGMLDDKAVSTDSKTSSIAKSLKAMGISAHDGATNMQRLLEIADKFHGMADGPTKLALAYQLFGKNAREILPFLNQGSEAIQQLMDKTKELGGVNEEAVEQGERLATSVNESKVAWEGLKLTLTQAFGPMLTKLVDGFIALVAAIHQSYEAGGIVKVIFDGLVEVVQGLMEIIHALGLGFEELFQDTGTAGTDWGAIIKQVVDGIVDLFKILIGAVVFLADAFIASFDLIKAGANNFLANWLEQTGQIKVIGTGLGEFMKVVGKVCEDALTLHWGEIAADWDAGMQHVHDVVQQKTNEILATTAHLRKQATDDFNAAMNLGKTFDAFAKNLANDNYSPKHDDFKMKFGGGTGEDPDIAAGGPKKAKKPKDDTVQKLEEELEQKKTIWTAEQLAQDQAQQFSLDSEAQFWAEALKRTDLSAKARYEIEKKYNAAALAAQNQAEDAKLAAMKREIIEDGNNWAKKVEDVRKWAAEVTRYYGVQSKQAEEASQEVAKVEKQAADAAKKAWYDYFKFLEEMQNKRIDDEEAQAQFEVEMGEKTKGQLLQEERKFEDRRYAMMVADIARQAKLIDPMHDPQAYAKLCQQLEQLEQQHQNKMNQIARQAALERTAIERGAINSVGQTFGNHISQMITLQEGWKQRLVGIYQGLVQTVADVVSQIIQKWVVMTLTKILLGKQETVANATNYVAMAGAGGVASMAAAPFPMDMTAPAFGASMAAAAAAFSVPAAEGGDWNVRAGLYHLHDDEMVLPAWAAEPLRGMIQASSQPSFMLGGTGTTNPATQGGGDAHYHYSPTVNHQDASWESMMRRSEREARRWFKQQTKLGHLLPPGQS